jgi:hypothetical protein
LRGRGSEVTDMTTYDLGSELHSDLRVALRDEWRAAPSEPMRSLEKKLIGFSLGIGLFLLAVLAVVNHFFPLAA